MHASDELWLELLLALDPLREAADTCESVEVRPAPNGVDGVDKAAEVGATRDVPLEQCTESGLVNWTDVF